MADSARTLLKIHDPVLVYLGAKQSADWIPVAQFATALTSHPGQFRAFFHRCPHRPITDTGIRGRRAYIAGRVPVQHCSRCRGAQAEFTGQQRERPTDPDPDRRAVRTTSAHCSGRRGHSSQLAPRTPTSLKSAIANWARHRCGLEVPDWRFPAAR